VRIVFDTNVLFAAFVVHGVCCGLYEEVLMHGRIVVSEFILEELRDKLLTKAKLSEEEVEEVLAAVRSDADLVDAPPLVASVCCDVDDDWILACALAGKASVIVTGDKDLLVLERHEGIRILTPRDCLALIRNT
jgi:putative PIN family toxin of toxin-antitoxin system